MKLNAYVKPGLIIFTIIALIINMIYTWNLQSSNLLNSIYVFILNFLAMLSGLIQLEIYLKDEDSKKKIDKIYRHIYPISTDELRNEYENIFDKSYISRLYDYLILIILIEVFCISIILFSYFDTWKYLKQIILT